MAVDVLVLKETAEGERRVAATPETVKKLVSAGAQVHLQAGAGTAAGLAGVVGCLGGAVAARAGMGCLVDPFGGDGGFVLLISACLLAIAFMVPTLWHKNVASAERAVKA